MCARLIGLCTVLVLGMVLGAASALAQRTEVVVHEGKVRAVTDKGAVVVGAGQKAVLKTGEPPVVTPEEPVMKEQEPAKAEGDEALVKDAMILSRWIEEEKQAGLTLIGMAQVQMVRIDSETEGRLAMLVDVPDVNAPGIPQDGTRLRVGLMEIQDFRFYDLEGQPLRVEVEPQGPNANQAYYYVYYPKPVPPGGGFKFVLTLNLNQECCKREGKVWYTQVQERSPYALHLFRVVLPRSAIFIASNVEPVCIEQLDGLTALTCRRYSGEFKDSAFRIAFLWPDRDGTSLADVPPEYRGLRDPRDVELSEEYHRGKTKILAGLPYRDQSSPLAALLSWQCAFAQEDKQLYADTQYDFKKDPQKKEEFLAKGFGEDLAKHRYWFVDNLDFLSTPALPEKLEEGYIHPVYVCRPGRLLRDDTHAFIYSGGKWYHIGNVGNPWDTDVQIFAQNR